MNHAIEIRKPDAESDAEVFALLAAFYNVNPDRALVSAMRNLETDGIKDEEAKTAVEKIKNYCLNTVTDDENERMTDLKRDWTKLFRGVAPDYGPKAPYEGVYKGAKDLKLVSELVQTYLDHGYTGYPEYKNRQDYIGVELAFAAFLFLMRVKAVMDDDQDKYDMLTADAEDFLDTHVRPWFGAFYENAQQHARTDFYRGVLDLTNLMLG